jgi:hypothetical protein
VGAVFERRPRWVARDFWAPELVRRGGRVLAYYAALGRDGRRCVAVASSARIRGPYRDHGPLVCSTVGEIDPLPVMDEHGADWLVWKRDGNSRGLPTPLLAAPLTPGGLRLGGLPQELFSAEAAWEGAIVEGPALMRRDGLLYLLYSAGRCCGAPCTYMTGVARSRSLLGPWEKRPEPLLADEPRLRCQGHVGIAGGPGAVPVLAHHAYLRGDPANRQLLIRRLSFGADGWPVVSDAGEVRASAPSVRLDFDGRRLDRSWQWPLGARPSVRLAGGTLRLGRGALARQAGTATFAAGTRVSGPSGGALPGVAVMASAGHAVGLELRGRRAIGWRVDGGVRSEFARTTLPRAAARSLRIAAGERIRFAVRTGRGWRAIGEPQEPPRWTGGPRVALRVSGPAGARAEFDELWIEPR